MGAYSIFLSESVSSFCRKTFNFALKQIEDILVQCLQNIFVEGNNQIRNFSQQKVEFGIFMYTLCFPNNVMFIFLR